MSSIRERAAALNLAEKLRARPQTPGAVVKSVHFTCLWNELVSHLKSSLTVKRHRILLKSHSDCFLGSEVVDELVSHITYAREFKGADVSRAAVACVCQALLDCQVFESVTTRVFGRDKKLLLFQDSKFVDVPSPSAGSLDQGVLEIQKLFGTLPAGRTKHASPIRSHAEPCTQVSPPQMSTEGPLQDTLSVETLVESLSPVRTQDDSDLSESLSEETWQEQILLRLLNLVELPLLEGVLQCTQTLCPSSLAQKNPEAVYSSHCLDRQVLRAFRESQSDIWLCAALDLLDFLPDQSVIKLSRELPSCFPPNESSSCVAEAHSSTDVARCKTLVFSLLVKHYGCVEHPPLLPRHMTDVYAAINDLLVKAKPESALEALQLCLKLLHPGSREELRRLLTFMALAADAGEVKLDKEVENRLTVKRCFSRAILHSRSLSREKEELMVMFMLSNIQDIFKIPAALHKQVSDKLLDVVQEKQPTNGFGVSGKTYTDSTRESTRQELWALLNSIHHDTKRSSKERKRLLGQFYQAHPEIFHQYFGDVAVGLL